MIGTTEASGTVPGIRPASEIETCFVMSPAELCRGSSQPAKKIKYDS